MIDQRIGSPAPIDDSSDFEAVTEHIRSLARRAAAGETAEQRAEAADALVQSIERLPQSMPAAQRSALLRSILDDPGLAQLKGRDGIVVRERLVALQLALGFPHALEVNPDQLAAAAKSPGWKSQAVPARAVTAVLGLLTASLSVLLADGTMHSTMMELDTDAEPGPTGGTWVLLAQAAYGLASLVLPLSTKLLDLIGGKRTVGAIGWAGLASPLAAVVLGILLGGVWLAVLFITVLSMLLGLGYLAIASSMNDPR